MPITGHRVSRQSDHPAARHAAACGHAVGRFIEVGQQDVAADGGVARQINLLAPGTAGDQVAEVVHVIAERDIAPGQATGGPDDMADRQISQRCLGNADHQRGQVVALGHRLTQVVVGIAQHQDAVGTHGPQRRGDVQALGAQAARRQATGDGHLAQEGVAAVQHAVARQVDLLDPAARGVRAAVVAHIPGQGGGLSTHQGAHRQIGGVQVRVRRHADRRSSAGVGRLGIGRAGLVDLVGDVSHYQEAPIAIGQIGHAHVQAGVVAGTRAQRRAMGQRAQVIGPAERAVAGDINLVGPRLSSRPHPRVGHVPLHGHDLAGLHPCRAGDGLHPQINRRCRCDDHPGCADHGVVGPEPALEHIVEGVSPQHQLVSAGQAIRHADLLGHVVTLAHAQCAAVGKVAQRDRAGTQGAVG